jgi:hypothetical protein
MDEIRIIGHIVNTGKMNIDPHHHTDNQTLDANLLTGITIIREINLIKGIEIRLPGRATIISKDINHQLPLNIQATNQELIAAQSMHPGPACSARNAAHLEITMSTLAQHITTIVLNNALNAGKDITTHPNAKRNEDRLHHSQATNR